jgi:hypothetical protein
MVTTCHNTRGSGYNITFIIMDNIPIMMVIKPINHVYIYIYVCVYIIIINLYQLDAYLLGGTAYPSRGWSKTKRESCKFCLVPYAYAGKVYIRYPSMVPWLIQAMPIIPPLSGLRVQSLVLWRSDTMATRWKGWWVRPRVRILPAT